jgi:hypothetical protein
MEQVKMSERICDVKCPDKDFRNCGSSGLIADETKKKCPFVSLINGNFYCTNPKVVS